MTLFQRLRETLSSLLFYLLLGAALGLIGWLAERHPMAWDWSASGRNTLSASSQQLLGRLTAPLHITSFTPEEPELRSRIRQALTPYLERRGDITLAFVNPDTQPELVRQYGIKALGELRLEYEGRGENLRILDEENIGNAIQRLLGSKDSWLAFLSGHAERSPDSTANHALGNFAAELRRKGYKAQTLELAQVEAIPKNTSLLVIASPEADYLPGEAARVRQWVEQGGNLLWLLEPGGLRGLEPLADAIGVRPLPGTILDPGGKRLGIDNPTFALVARYPDHPATQGFEPLTLYPQAAALGVEAPTGWIAQPLLSTLSGTWNETGPLQGKVSWEPALGEKEGPLPIGLALTRQQAEREQRLLVVGDGDFLSNAYLGNAGNLDLGLNLVRWLSGDEKLLQIPARTAPDRNLELSQEAGIALGLLFLFALPILLATTGLLIWWRRRRL